MMSSEFGLRSGKSMHKILIVGGWGRHFKLKSLTATALKLLDMLSISQISIDSGRGGNIWGRGGGGVKLKIWNIVIPLKKHHSKVVNTVHSWKIEFTIRITQKEFAS